jgi:EpsI family protein
MTKTLIVLFGVLTAVAYRRLWFWDPGQPGTPDAEWFFFGPSDTAPMVVLLIVVCLLVLSRRRLSTGLEGEGSLALALPWLTVSAALFAWGHHADAADLVLGSLATGVLGAALWLCGPRLARPMLLPLLVLVFAVPLPGVLLNQILYPLQISAAEVVERILSLIGQPTLREGDILYLSEETFEVIESCSGLRSIQVLTMLALAWVAVFSVRPLHAALLVVSAPVIAYLVNALRVLSLVLYPQPELSAAHALQGVAMLLLGLAVLMGVDALLGRLLGSSPPPGPPTSLGDHRAEAISRRRRLRVALLGALLLAFCGISGWVHPWAPDTPGDASLVALPKEIGEWHGVEDLPLDGNYLGSTRFSQHVYRRYERAGDRVKVFIGFDDRLHRDRSLLSPKNAYDGPGWDAERVERFERDPGGPIVAAVQARSGSRRVLSHVWYVGTQSTLAETLRALFALDQSMLRRPGGAFVVRLSTGLGGGGLQEAEARLRELGRAAHASLPIPDEDA